MERLATQVARATLAAKVLWALQVVLEASVAMVVKADLAAMVALAVRVVQVALAK